MQVKGCMCSNPSELKTILFTFIPLQNAFLSYLSVNDFNTRKSENNLFPRQRIVETYVVTFQLDLNFRTRDLNPFVGVNSSPFEALNMIVLLCCSSLSALASCKDTCIIKSIHSTKQIFATLSFLESIMEIHYAYMTMLWSREGVGVLPYIGYIGYIGMCGPKGYSFLAVLV